MTQLTVSFDEIETEKLEWYMNKWKLSKYETIKKIIRNFFQNRNDKIKLETEKKNAENV